MIRNFFELFSKIQKYSDVYDIPVHRILIESTVNKLRYELSLDEQITCNIFQGEVRKNPKLALASRTKMNRLLEGLNKYPHDIIGDKALFRYYAKALGVLAPTTFLVFECEPETGLCHGVTECGDFLIGKEKWLEYLRSNLGDKFIVKSAFGLGGKNIGLFRHVKGDTYCCQDQNYTIEQIYDEIVVQHKYGKCVVQRVAENHPEIVRVTGSKTLQCFRIITLRNRGGDIVHYSLGFKLSARPDNDTDNFLLGTTGNLYCLIDINTLQMSKAYDYDHDKLRFVEVKTHPYTGENLIGWKIPYVEEAVHLAKKVHAGLSTLRALGWDIAISPEGPMVIEGNTLWAGGGRHTPYFAQQDCELMLEMIESEHSAQQEKAA